MYEKLGVICNISGDNLQPKDFLNGFLHCSACHWDVASTAIMPSSWRELKSVQDKQYQYDMNSEQKQNHELIFYKAVDGEFRFDQRVYLKLGERERIVSEIKCGRFGLSNDVFFFTLDKGKYHYEKLYLNIIPEG